MGIGDLGRTNGLGLNVAFAGRCRSAANSGFAKLDRILTFDLKPFAECLHWGAGQRGRRAAKRAPDGRRLPRPMADGAGME
jgi:hypothetical protein